MGLPESLVDQSTLTPRQLEALQSYLRVALGEIRYRDAASTMSRGRMKEGKPLSIGSYFRTVQQARENVRKSIITVLIGIWLGVVKSEDVRRLLDVAGGGVRELPDEERDRLVAVLQALVQKIVM